MKRILLFIAAGLIGYLVVSRYRQGQTSRSQPATTSPYKPIIEDVLHQHEGEESPIVQAFEAALEEERQHEEKLAHDTGVRS